MQDSLSVYTPNSFLETKHTKIDNKVHLGVIEGAQGSALAKGGRSFIHY